VILEIGHLQNFFRNFIAQSLKIGNMVVIVRDLFVLYCLYASRQLKNTLFGFKDQKSELLVERCQLTNLFGSEETEEIGQCADIN
jgi:hypothetical protein